MPRLYPFIAGSFAAIELRASAAFSAGKLALSFSLSGDSAALAKLVLPPPAAPDATGQRRDHLWQSTCWECFVAEAKTPGYFEINLSPDHHWNIYHFTDYRQGMSAVSAPPPLIHSRREESFYHLDALITGLSITNDPANLAHFTNCRLGLTAVLARVDGETGYFALSHPGEKPDFHHPDGFIFRLVS